MASQTRQIQLLRESFKRLKAPLYLREPYYLPDGRACPLGYLAIFLGFDPSSLDRHENGETITFRVQRDRNVDKADARATKIIQQFLTWKLPLLRFEGGLGTTINTWVLFEGLKPQGIARRLVKGEPE
jgi:hypothetical protein